MLQLTIANIEFLKLEISKAGLTYSHLQNDLIDHVCCDVEHEMLQGLPFDKAYDRVKQKIGLNGLQRIQEDTLFLIDKNYRIMKTLMKISGVIAPIFIAVGTLFKIEHWPAAGIMLFLGFIFLGFLFLPSAIYVSYKEISNRSRKWTHITGFLGTFILSFSFLFKVQHWPGTGILLIVGILITCFVFLPSLLFHKLKDTNEKVPKYVFVIAFIGFIVYLVGFTCKMQHWPGARLFLLIGAILFIFIALPIYVYKSFKEHQHITNSFIFIVIALIWFILPTTLIALKVSGNIFKSNLKTENTFVTDIQFLIEKNDSLFHYMQDNAQTIKIKNDCDTLFRLIQQIKINIIRYSEGENANSVINSKNKINVENLKNFGSIGICFEVLKNGKGNELKKLYENLRLDMLNVTTQKEFTDIVAGTLPKEIDEDIFNKEETAIFYLNSLSFLQVNILNIEYEALFYLFHKQIITN